MNIERTTYPRPDWESYRYKPTAELWKAVALWCDIDPDEFNDVFIFSSNWFEDLCNLKVKYPEYGRRLTIAKDNLGIDGGLEHAIRNVRANYPPGCTNLVNLPAFMSWAKTTGIEPNGFDALDVVDKKTKELQPRERETLLKIIAVLAKMQYGDISEPFAVAAEILKDLSTHGISYQPNRKTLANKIRQGAELIQ